jgi:hypothetical protein
VIHPHDTAAHHGEQSSGGGDQLPGSGRLAQGPEAPPVTGDPVVDEAVALLQDATTVPVDEQPGIYDTVHRALQDRLADVEG